MAAPHNDHRKEKILQAATQLLTEKSFNEISLSEIARRSGLAKGSVYYYYKTKDDLLYDVADGYLMGMYEELTSWLENKEKDTSLPRLLRFVLSRGADDPASGLRLHLTVDAVDGNERIAEKLKERYQIFRKVIGETVALRKAEGETGDADAEYYGWLVLTVIDGLMMQILLGNSQLNAPAFIERFIREMEK